MELVHGLGSDSIRYHILGGFEYGLLKTVFHGLKGEAVTLGLRRFSTWCPNTNFEPAFQASQLSVLGYRYCFRQLLKPGSQRIALQNILTSLWQKRLLWMPISSSFQSPCPNPKIYTVFFGRNLAFPPFFPHKLCLAASA